MPFERTNTSKVLVSCPANKQCDVMSISVISNLQTALCLLYISFTGVTHGILISALITLGGWGFGLRLDNIQKS